jgi:crotonobetainyl-CoA:carnitine CoA-transferase CaiB-like acyl-CoA transferase
MTLADFGADVLKVEESPHGDYSRAAPPTYEKESIYYLNVNRGKRSVVLDLRQAAIRRLRARGAVGGGERDLNSERARRSG